MPEITVSEAAQRAELSAYHLRRLLKDEVIVGRRVPIPGGHYWMVDVESLDRYINDWRARKPGARRKQKQQPESDPGPDMPLLALGAMV